MRKVFYVIIPILVLILVGEIAYTFVLDKKDTKNEIVDKDNNGDKDVEKEEEILYHIYAHQKNYYPNGEEQPGYYQLDMYDFLITKDYDVLMATKSLMDEEKKDYINKETGVFEFEVIYDKLMNSEHSNLLKLTKSQKQMLKEVLENQEYTLELGSDVSFNLDDDYYVVNYKTNKAYKNEGDYVYHKDYNDTMVQLITALMDKNLLYFDYVKRDNNVNNYIKDKDYQKLDINSDLVKELYEKVKFRVITDNYMEEKITNNLMITLTLQQMEKERKFDDNCNQFARCYFEMKQFDNYIKNIFGPNAVYNIDEYTGGGNSCKSYGLDKNGLYLTFGSGCGMEEDMIVSLETAYETDKKIVIIEKGIYVTDVMWCEESKLCNKYQYAYPVGFYNNVKEHILITKNISDYSQVDFDFSKYEPFVTYYSYTFTKGEDGEYYFTDFARLN